MSLNSKNAGAVTPVKENSKSTPSKKSENINPNVTKSAIKLQKSAQRNPNPISSPSPHKKIRERKFVVAKKNSKRDKTNTSLTCKCKASDKSHKCLCVAYENLRASQEEFFKNPTFKENVLDEIEPSNETDSGNLKRKSAPEPECGTVMHLIKAFEKLSSLPKSDGSDEIQEKDMKGSFCTSDFSLTPENLGLDSRASFSSDSSGGSISSRTSNGSRRNSFGRKQSKRKQPRVTSQKPFKLRTEQRGRSKEEEFVKKVQQMMTEEEKQRIPIAQGLPLTTDEPECLAKPPVKETTRPIDLVLHSDVRAVERSEFDQQVAEKLSLIEQYKMERERQQKLAEEEEIRRLRRELVPKAQPLPYFDRPFVPRRSVQHPTIPKEPKFHLPQHKKICMSWNDNMYTYQQSAEVKCSDMRQSYF